MKEFIKKKLHEDLEYYHVNDASPEKDEFNIVGEDILGDKWEMLEADVQKVLIPLIEKHKDAFGVDSYGVIDAIHQVFDQMFQKVAR